MVELLLPGSFSVFGKKGAAVFGKQGEAALPQLAYFSFTTLTTLGLGEIVPLTPLARSFVMLEGLVGQLFPVILIARLVAMQIDYQQRNRPH
jgi:hypothetical protein